MSAARRSRSNYKRKSFRRKTKNGRRHNGSPNSLVFFLSLVVLIETLLLLFLLPKNIPSEKSKKTYIKETRLEEQKTAVQKPKPKKIAKRPIKSEKRVTVSEKLKSFAPKEKKGKIAIVIDDWGYNTRNINLLKDINFPITLAILPFRNYSQTIAEFAHRHNFEIIIHMPMEPKNKERVGLEPKTLMTYMGNDTVSSILNEAFNDIPYAKGINNHMGSKATEDEELMIIVLDILKKKDVYFLDSYVTNGSICYDLSRKIGVKFARRSVFLDNRVDSSYIKKQLLQLAKKSEESGYAIGIGHDKTNTIEVLKKEIPSLEKEGYDFVYVSQLVK